MRPLFCLILFALCLLAPSACDGPDTPLDADTRRQIDSLSSAGIRRARQEIDSLCKVWEQTKLPGLVDSFRQVRLREIEEQMKTVPR